MTKNLIATLILIPFTACMSASAAVDGEDDATIPRDAGLGATEQHTEVIADDVSIDGSLVVGDQLTVFGQVTFNGPILERLAVEDDVWVERNVTAVRDVFHGTPHIHTIPGASMVDAWATHSRLISPPSAAVIGYTLSPSRDAITIPLAVDTADTIRSYCVYVHKTSASAKIMTTRIYRVGTDGVEVAMGAGKTLSNPGGAQSMCETDVTIPVLPGNQYYINFVPSGAVGDRLYHAEAATVRIGPTL